MKQTLQTPRIAGLRILVKGLCCLWITSLAWASSDETSMTIHKSAIKPEAAAIAPTDAIKLAETWGIEVTALRLTAAGHMLDFRYRILDPAKAVALMDRRDKPILIHQDSGKKTGVPVPPKVGRLRQRSNTPKVERQYFMLFANPGHYFKAGDKVTIEIGKFRAANLKVEG